MSAFEFKLVTYEKLEYLLELYDKMIIDADFCIKLGGSDKYRYLYDILPLVAKTIYMHTYVPSTRMWR